MDRESFRQQQHSLSDQIELSRQRLDGWFGRQATPSMTKVGLRLLLRYGLTSLIAKSPISLLRFFLK